MSSETDLSRAIRDALGKLGIPSERVQSGKVRVRGGVMHLAGKGTPDIVTPYGWLEFKLPGEKPDAHQLEWHRKWRALGVNVDWADTVQRAVSLVLEWRQACGQ